MEQGVNWYRTRRHYSDRLFPVFRGEGRSGTALCGAAIWDQDGINYVLRNYRATDYGRKSIDISQIQECKRCARSKDKVTVEGIEP